MRITPRRGGKMLIILGILWLGIALAATFTGSVINLTLQVGLILYGGGVAVAAIGFLFLKLGKT